uniref:Uncharacterized protein n=1 Tax=Rhizophora mucronata TaxID=61149 RepID=A0A2P2QR75_RHIMU
MCIKHFNYFLCNSHLCIEGQV